jgi:ABC-type multidrug transport system ATPase subunit
VTEYVVQTEGLTKRFGERLAVDDIALCVRRGEVYGFLGPNGAGKTTTLRMLLGLVKPTSGRATVLGAAPGSRQSLAKVGMLVESPACYPYLSGRDNLRVMGRYAGTSKRRVDEVLATVDLSARADDKAGNYSLGMKQRLGVAAALLGDPELLILDEPTNGLDPAGMADMRALIRALGAEGRTVLLSSHLLGEVQQVCDRVGVVAGGRLLREGTVDELRGQGVVRATVDHLDDALAVVHRLLGEQSVTVADHALLLRTDQDRAGGINRELVLAGVTVRSLTWEEKSLEEVFLTLTAGTELGGEV